MIEVGFAMGGEPSVVKVRADATASIVKDFDGLAVFVFVAVRADEVAGDVEVAAESIDAVVVIFRTAGCVIVAIAVSVTLRLVIGSSRRSNLPAELAPQ